MVDEKLIQRLRKAAQDLSLQAYEADTFDEDAELNDEAEAINEAIKLLLEER
jgi:hypothetical protein